MKAGRRSGGLVIVDPERVNRGPLFLSAHAEFTETMMHYRR